MSSFLTAHVLSPDSMAFSIFAHFGEAFLSFCGSLRGLSSHRSVHMFPMSQTIFCPLPHNMARELQYICRPHSAFLTRLCGSCWDVDVLCWGLYLQNSSSINYDFITEHAQLHSWYSVLTIDRWWFPFDVAEAWHFWTNRDSWLISWACASLLFAAHWETSWAGSILAKYMYLQSKCSWATRVNNPTSSLIWL